MERNSKPKESLSDQIKKKVFVEMEDEKEYDGDFGTVISTGSTLLDLAISGGRIRGGGLPGGILVEAFGPSGSGKTVLLSEIAGSVQRQGGEIMFADPEARLNRQFASMFGLELDEGNYSRPDTVTDLFKSANDWEPKSIKNKKVNGIFADSLAALSTTMEMSNDEGDKMGMKRAKDFSEQLRKFCRIIADKNYLMVCSNQVRVNIDAGQYGEKYTTPGGVSIGFYSCLRLRFMRPEKIKEEKTFQGKKVIRVIGVEVQIEVYKSSIWKPFRSAPVYILFDYGIDDIRSNLQFIKTYTKNRTYTVNGESLDVSMKKSIEMVEKGKLESALKEEVIDLWEEIEGKFEQERKPKR
jgi:protein RecA